ncbi:hypothetical protein DFH29DRAFT_1009630 [Suillus ampliporus]|nr:hypothetical protein DFH29DRAFT_1009630 [Suillus ampliporus]
MAHPAFRAVIDWRHGFLVCGNWAVMPLAIAGATGCPVAFLGWSALSIISSHGHGNIRSNSFQMRLYTRVYTGERIHQASALVHERQETCVLRIIQSKRSPQLCKTDPSGQSEWQIFKPGTPLTTHPPQEVSHAVSSHNVLASACDTILSTVSMQIDEEGLSLAQRRSRCIGVPMPVHYRQYDDVLLQPPPSVPSGQTQQQEINTPTNSIDTSIRAQTSSQEPPFRTARNVFGLVCQFFTSTPPSHDPEEVVTLLDISSVPVASPADIPAELSDMSFHPYPNRSSFELGNWYWNGGVQKSQQSFKELDKINSQLGASIDVEGRDEWEDEDAGWRKTQVTIEVPFSRTTPQPDVRPYIAADLYHRSLVSVIWEKLANTQDNELFHYEPYQL